MKFGEYLWTHLTPEWYSQYIEDDEMKMILADAVTEAEQLFNNNDHASREEFFLRADDEFFQFCQKQLTKIDTFFAEKLAEALRLFEPLKNKIDDIQHRTHSRERSDSINASLPKLKTWFTRMTPDKVRQLQIDRRRHQTISDLKSALSEFYLMLVLLKNYQSLNSTGFRKILKKHDKLFLTTRGDQWRQTYVDEAPFQTSTKIEELIDEVETLFTNAFESGNRTLAMQRLRVPPLEEKQPHIVTFRLGVFVGMISLLIPAVILLSWTLYESRTTHKSLDWQSALHLYRSSFLIILQIILVGINFYGWSHSGVNHILIFEIDPRHHLTYQRMLEIGTFLMVLWFLSFIAFIVSSYYEAQPFVQPLVLIVFLIVFLLNPMRIFYSRSRRWLFRNLGRVFLSPFYHVNFTAFWLGDQLTSLELIFFDLQYLLCFYINDVGWRNSSGGQSVFCSGWSKYFLQTVFIMLPSWFRFAQCLRRYRDTKAKFPHLVNAGKYASGFFVAISNTFRRAYIVDYQDRPINNPFLYIWIIAALISSIYKLYWDFKMDWGFFDRNAGENRFLREQIVYSSKIYYYAAMIQNVLFRFIWMINIFTYFDNSTAEYADIIGFAFALVEVIRRFIWNYFRLENEHVNNCGEFRAVRDISIQMATSVATGYTKILESIGTASSMEERHNAKQRQSTLSEERMTAIARRRRMTTMSNESIPLKSIDSERTRSVTSNSNTLVVINPNYSQN